MKNDQLKCEIKNGRLLISIGISRLIDGAKTSDEFLGEELNVEDEDGFAQDILQELIREEEDGSTPLDKLFDVAALNALENGSAHASVTEAE